MSVLITTSNKTYENERTRTVTERKRANISKETRKHAVEQMEWNAKGKKETQYRVKIVCLFLQFALYVSDNCCCGCCCCCVPTHTRIHIHIHSDTNRHTPTHTHSLIEKKISDLLLLCGILFTEKT